MKLLAALTLLGLSVSTAPAFAWGQEGHSIVAEVAQHRLSAKAYAAVETILKTNYALATPPQTAPIGDVSLASLASWADDYRASHKETGNWHFVDIPYDVHSGVAPSAIVYDPARDCPPTSNASGTCLVNALPDLIATLKATPAAGDNAAALKRWQALLFITHLVGDLHQPLHCAQRDDDQGGNALDIHIDAKRPDGKTNYSYSGTFHSLFDTGLILLHVYAWGNYVTEIETKTIPSLDVGDVSKGSYVDWANACHTIAVKAYDHLPKGTPVSTFANTSVVLDATYAGLFEDDITNELAKAGIRLANILNAALDP